MALTDLARIWVATFDTLVEGSTLRVNVLFLGAPASVLVCRLQGNVHAYLNKCVHMPRELDSEDSVIIDETGSFLRCSMHGIVYEPATGKSVSALCNGERLTEIRISTDEQDICCVNLEKFLLWMLTSTLGWYRSDRAFDQLQ